VSQAQAREEARRILSERRFHGTNLPHPFRGFLDWLGRHLHFISRFWNWLAPHVGGAHVLWVIVAVTVVALATFVSTRLARRRVGADLVAASHAGRGSEDPADLEREADKAEKSGDFEAAVRLRFRAGLLRLGRANVVQLRPSLRTYEVRRKLRNPRFDRLARDFDEIVYGERVPVAADPATARTEWPRVVEEARR
jgi:hypothetical protein